ncbi:hypothetical protein CLPUN_13270 [Clostridium puniceum]|uniref:Uncharacterized protein n=1 Tax=Clostridium puniceum TaxID=29367 RepID=A0A1S8TS92_9CLOT|nr:hypothetical protein [Clostridium puniceum]OOM80479.1 hypothetical protein CLPUN_13270 [Clostridium puniceum]
MSYATDIRKDGEIKRLKTKCKHASEVLEQIEESMSVLDLTLDEQKEDLIKWIDSVREYLSKE